MYCSGEAGEWSEKNQVVDKISRIEYCPGLRRFGGPPHFLRGAVTVVAISLFGSACSSSDTSGPDPDPVTVTFRVQPTAVEAGASILPAVEVATSSDASQTVMLSIADNDCGALLAGQSSRVTVDGVATFPGLAVDIPADDFRLEARVLDQTTRSAPFDVVPRDIGGSLEQHASVCLQDHGNGDAASLAWVSQDDVLWTADDNQNRVFGFDRQTGARVSTVTEEDLLTAFPDAAECDDGDGNPATSCSYTNEFEVVAYDEQARHLYVFNTVNDPGSPTIIDRPAVFRLRTGGCRGCVEYDDWNPLPDGYSYRAAVVIDEQLYISNGPNLHAYDFDTNTVTEQPALQPLPSTITGLSSQHDLLYAVTLSRLLIKVEWEQDEIEDSYDLTPIGVQRSDGVAVVRDTVYVVEGEPGNPVFVVTIDDNS